MQDEQIRVEENVDDNTDYIAAIKELKQNSVSREDYNRLKTQNKQLLDSLVNGSGLEQVEAPKRPSKDELRAILANQHSNNLDYCKAAIELREQILEEGGSDPFLPQSGVYQVTDADIVTANKVATIMKECIEYADGDSLAFTNELMRRTNDTAMPKKK